MILFYLMGSDQMLSFSEANTLLQDKEPREIISLARKDGHYLTFVTSF